MTFFVCKLEAQHNLLGQTQKYITKLYELDPEYIVQVDTIGAEKVLITCKTSTIYPYYTYELDVITDKCISYGFVSRNREVLRAQLEILSYVGKLIERDSTSTNFIYVVNLPEKRVFYSIKQPFSKSTIKTRQDLFYIMVTEEKKKLKLHE